MKRKFNHMGHSSSDQANLKYSCTVVFLVLNMCLLTDLSKKNLESDNNLIFLIFVMQLQKTMIIVSLKMAL